MKASAIALPVVVGAAGLALVALAILRPDDRGVRFTEVATDWHDVLCVRTAREVRTKNYRSLSHGRGYDVTRSDGAQWIAKASNSPLRLVRDVKGTCTALLDGFETPEQKAAGQRTPQWTPDGRVLVPEARLTAEISVLSEDRVLDVCWNRPDGSVERCEHIDVATLPR